MKFLQLALILASISFMSCKIQSIPLEGKWTHQYEKDHDGLQVYVKGEYLALPPARFRQVFVFLSDNTCKYGNLAANDQHGMDKGTYKLTKEKLIIYDQSGSEKFKFQINATEEDLMVFKKL